MCAARNAHHHTGSLLSTCAAWRPTDLERGGGADLSPSVAGIVFVSGQLADAVATPLVGLSSDATPARVACCSLLGLGRRKLWHVGGTVLASTAFAFTFLGWTPFPQGSTATVAYLSLCAGLFNVGWASVQVSHLALIPELHSSPVERTRLQTARFSSTIAANIEVCSDLRRPTPTGRETLDLLLTRLGPRIGLGLRPVCAGRVGGAGRLCLRGPRAGRPHHRVHHHRRVPRAHTRARTAVAPNRLQARKLRRPSQPRLRASSARAARCQRAGCGPPPRAPRPRPPRPPRCRAPLVRG